MKKLQYGFLALCLSASALMAQNKLDKLEQLEPEATKKIELSKSVSPQGTNGTNATTAVATYDFTTGSDKYYGGAAGAKEVETGVWAMVAGDANGDGSVNATDYNDFWLLQNGNPYNYSTTGADFNLDASINAADYNDYWLLNNGKVTQVP